MGQRAALAALDAQIHAAMVPVGFADAGSYVPKGGNPSTDAVPCGVFIDRGQQQMGEFGQLVGARDIWKILRADVPEPEQGATVTADGETVKLVSEVESDDGTSRWVVSHV